MIPHFAEEPESKVLFAREMVVNEAVSELQVRAEYKGSRFNEGWHRGTCGNATLIVSH
jgi:hypothetical protein